MSQTSLITLVYTSNATCSFEQHDLVQLLAFARYKNARNEITGMLVYVDQEFLQILEGPADSVDATYRRIEGDTRHIKIRVVTREPISARRFPDWSMAFAATTPDQLARIPGFKDLASSEKPLASLSADNVGPMIASFLSGQLPVASHSYTAELNGP